MFLEESRCVVAAVVLGAELGADTVGHLEGGGGQSAGGGEEAGLDRQMVAVVGAAVEDLVVRIQVVLRKVRLLVHEAPECVCRGEMWPQGGARGKIDKMLKTKAGREE